MRLSDLVACDCLALITFSDPDQARQIAASDRSLQCLQDLDIIIIIIHFSEPSLLGQCLIQLKRTQNSVMFFLLNFIILSQ